MNIMSESIRLDLRKQTIAIVRTPKNLAAYGIIEATGMDVGRRRLDPYFDFEFSARMPSDCGVVAGDMLIVGSDYYMVMGIEPKQIIAEVGYFKMSVFKCNTIVDIYTFTIGTNNYTTLAKSNVHCLITQVRANEWSEDKALLVPKYRGRQQPFQLYVQASSGIVSGYDCVLVDSAGRRFRISKNIDVFISDGISQTQIMWER
jgi:hypothetical protein